MSKHHVDAMRTLSKNLRRHRSQSPAFAVIDVLLAIVFFGMMFALVLVAILAARTAAERVPCQENLRQIGTAYHKFITDAKGPSAFKSDTTWMNVIRDHYLEKSEAPFICPSDTENATKPTGQRIIPSARVFVKESIFDSLPMGIPLAEDGARCRLSGKATLTPPSYALEFEFAESGRQWDWNDLIVRVDPHPDGSITITPASEISLAYDLVGPNDEVLVGQFPSSASYTFPPSAHKHYSYGVNSMASHFSQEGDGNKLLAVDYKKRVCNVVTNNVVVPPKRTLDYWPFDCAPRHGKALNVLFQAGHVKSMKPNDLDPRVIKLRNLYWLPTAYQYVDPLIGG